jgi:hypothetical protein
MLEPSRWIVLGHRAGTISTHASAWPSEVYPDAYKLVDAPAALYCSRVIEKATIDGDPLHPFDGTFGPQRFPGPTFLDSQE